MNNSQNKMKDHTDETLVQVTAVTSFETGASGEALSPLCLSGAHELEQFFQDLYGIPFLRRLVQICNHL